MSVVSLNEEEFNKDLYQFHEKRGTKIVKIPIINRIEFNFYRVFQTVQKHGGFEVVNQNNLWRMIAFESNHPIPNNSTVFFIRHYTHYLLPYERVKVLHLPDKPNATNLAESMYPDSPEELFVTFLSKFDNLSEKDVQQSLRTPSLPESNVLPDATLDYRFMYFFTIRGANGYVCYISFYEVHSNSLS